MSTIKLKLEKTYLTENYIAMQITTWKRVTNKENISQNFGLCQIKLNNYKENLQDIKMFGFFHTLKHFEKKSLIKGQDQDKSKKRTMTTKIFNTYYLN